jgi:hypothetical protein
MIEQAKFQTAAWRDRLDDQVAFSASEVQARLFELYGALEGNPTIEQVKTWLLLTRQRELFSSDELTAFLAEIELELELASVEESTSAGSPA